MLIIIALLVGGNNANRKVTFNIKLWHNHQQNNIFKLKTI